MNKNERLERKNKKWLEKYGVSYTECLGKRTKKERYKTIYFWKILKKCKGYGFRYFLSGFAGVLLGIISLLSPILMERTINNITSTNYEVAIYFAIALAGFSILSNLLSYFYIIFNNNITANVSDSLRKKMALALTKTKISIFDTTNSGEIVNRVNSDAISFSSNIQAIIINFFRIFSSLAFTIYSLFINIWLGLILIFIGVISNLVSLIYTKFFQGRYSRRNSNLNDITVGTYTETVRGIRDVKNLNITEAILSKLFKNSTYKSSVMKDEYIVRGGFNRIKLSLIAIFLAVFFAVSIVFIQNRIITLASFIVLLTYRNDVLNFFSYITDMRNYINNSEINAERIYQVLEDKDYPKEKFGNKKIKKIKGELEFKDVDFGYKEDKLLFENLNLKILPNECVGFVGKSGQGKSTIINLIPKLYEVNSGKILLDGIDINKLTEESLRDNICVVSQNPYIFNVSIKENLLFAKNDASDEEIQEVCKKAYIDDFIESLPEKYNTKVGEGGVQLSGGQRQRLAIARALLKNSKIILFDEATSALDNESQEKIQQAINEMKKEKTIIIVAHRLTTVKDCDKIFVLDNHKIVGEGTHKALMKSCDRYKNLYHNEIE